MQDYSSVALEQSRQVTLAYSTSFSAASRLLGAHLRPQIYAIYGLVRLADEIVDTLRPDNMSELLNNLEAETLRAMKTGVSTNLLVHSYARTARQFGFEEELTTAFFASMRQDIAKRSYNKKQYQAYIYGSAEVVGLMCLHVFTDGKRSEYKKLKDSAQALGSALQKVNFLRDISSDYKELGRTYFPGVNFAKFSNEQKDKIVLDIKSDFTAAKPAIKILPKSSRYGVRLAFYYYQSLLKKIEKAEARHIKSTRIRVNNMQKLSAYGLVWLQKLFSL